jgi:hypothetical protein
MRGTERRIVLRTMAHLIDDETVAKMGHPSGWYGQMWATRPLDAHIKRGSMNTNRQTTRVLDVVNVMILTGSEALIFLIQTRHGAYDLGSLAFWFLPSLIVIPWSTSVFLSRELSKFAKSSEESTLINSCLWRISLLSLVTTVATFVCLTSFLKVPGISSPK